MIWFTSSCFLILQLVCNSDFAAMALILVLDHMFVLLMMIFPGGSFYSLDCIRSFCSCCLLVHGKTSLLQNAEEALPIN